MRTRSLKLPLLIGLLSACIGVAAVGCYSPGDLGDKPFRCTADHPECPDKYICDLDNTHKDTFQWCVRDTTVSALTVPGTVAPAAQAVPSAAVGPSTNGAARSAPLATPATAADVVDESGVDKAR